MDDTFDEVPVARSLGRFTRRRGALIAGMMALAITAIFLTNAFARVLPGYVGIRVNNIGGNAGVVSQPLPVGWYFAPPGTNIYEYPVFTRTYSWTRSATEQTRVDEAFNFQDKNGLALSADVAVAYHVDASRAPILFQRYRTDMDAIIAGPLRNAIRNAIVERGAQLGVEEIYGPHKSELIQTALRHVQAYFAPVGLQVEQLYWAGNIVVPDAVLQQINAKIANEQQALAAQANVATARADAEARVAKAEGDARAIQVEAQAIRTNPEIVNLRAVEKWDGKLPTYTGASAPLPFIGAK
ncbi:MAG: SPFH domain-containing protein [Sphingomonas sp.]|nr:SPFH domain-containing protein [Sphingomonas sp.]WEJ98762.1 MAG: SPFH domain-containing protein [Sphingomonas sp.]